MTPTLDDTQLTPAAHAFVAGLGWADGAAHPLAGDASGRRYWRLITPARRAILMSSPVQDTNPPCPSDAPPATRRALGWNAVARLAANRVEAFVCVCEWLHAQGLSAPEVYGVDAAQGLALVEDLGDDLYARVLAQHVSAEDALYDAAWDVLQHIHARPLPHTLSAHGLTWPVLAYDAVALTAGADLFLDWLPRLDARWTVSEAARHAWDALWGALLPPIVATPPVLVLRDYHAENLLWLPQRQGLARVGLIDVQDAVAGHPAWDALMLLQDARRDVSPAVAARLWDAFTAHHGAALRGQAAVLGVVNTTRILGVFARLAVRDGKRQYLDFMPRQWAALAENLRHPDAEPLAAWFATYMPVVRA